MKRTAEAAMIHKHKGLPAMIAIVLILGAMFYFVTVVLNDKTAIRSFVEQFGIFGPLVIIFLVVLEVVLAPIPGVFIAMGSGYAFGPFLGFVYSYIGNVIGTIIAFWLSRKYGRPLAQRLIKGDKLDYYDSFFREKGVHGLWIAYCIPVFPTDILSFVTGLSNVRFRHFLAIITIAYIPNLLILNYLGDSILSYGFGLKTFLISGLITAMVLVFSLFYWKRKRL